MLNFGYVDFWNIGKEKAKPHCESLIFKNLMKPQQDHSKFKTTFGIADKTKLGICVSEYLLLHE